jgi:SAM-dependent methyltransferase
MSKAKTLQQEYYNSLVERVRRQPQKKRYFRREVEDVYSLFYQDLVSSFLPQKKQKILVDIGCGTEPLYKILEPICESYVACDISRSSLNVLRGKGKNVSAILCDVESLPLKDSISDFLFGSHYIEHVVNQEKAIFEIERISKQGALILIMTPNRYGLPELLLTIMGSYGLFQRKRVGHINLRTPKELEDKINATKHLTIVSESCTGIFHLGGFDIPLIGAYLSPAKLIALLSFYNIKLSIRILAFEQRIAQANRMIAHDIIMLLRKAQHGSA